MSGPALHPGGRVFSTAPAKGLGESIGRFGALANVEGIVHIVTSSDGPDPRVIRHDPGAAGPILSGALDLDGIAWMDQVHGGDVLAVDRPGCAGRGDALVTGRDGLGLMGRSADCPLILAADVETGVIGVAHASWRSTAGRIGPRMVERMVGDFAARPERIVAGICPSAGACCYEVGEDVLDAMRQGVGDRVGAFFPVRDGAMCLDLWGLNAAELAAAGVPPGHIHVAGLCTICSRRGERPMFPSHRRNGDAAGRFAAVIALWS